MGSYRCGPAKPLFVGSIPTGASLQNNELLPFQEGSSASWGRDRSTTPGWDETQDSIRAEGGRAVRGPLARLWQS